MKNKKKKIIEIIQIPAKLLLILLIIFYSYEYLNKVFINKDISRGDEFRALPKNSIDVLVLGSSDAQFSFVPNFFFEDTGLYSYVRGTPCQPLEVSYEMLKESLKTQKPKIVLLEVFTAMPLRKICEDDVCYVTAQYQMTGNEKYNTINYLPKEKAKEYRNEFINYHNDWRTRTDYESILPKNVFNSNKHIDSNFGYVYQYSGEEIPKNYWLPLEHNNDIDISLDFLDILSLNKIYALCKENNIELILYKTPLDSITQEDQSSLHKVWEWASQNSIKYIDFLSLAKELKFYMQIHSDSFHCYINGASMLTKYIADFINENCDIEHKTNDMLDELYKSNVGWLTKDVLNTEYDPLVYLPRLENTEGIVCIKYEPYKKQKITQGLYNSICAIGCTYFDVNYDYCAIVRNGELLIEGSDSLNSSFDDYRIIINKNAISINDVEYETKGPITVIYLPSNLNEAVIKNIDYIPFPWDYEKEPYIVK